MELVNLKFRACRCPPKMFKKLDQTPLPNTASNMDVTSGDDAASTSKNTQGHSYSLRPKTKPFQDQNTCMDDSQIDALLADDDHHEDSLTDC
ncbi:hypothetical protein O0I10_012453 [Lichtheimia ornata]|uniref:Uncharacterized protein n=1 Tax=Lichtheimia ornata TaxID=688661 RepID=A0AAD7XPK8_9FUNG|nr:uncharacterized protein O0I10_012453 [Lichtheimia ornata]KAJ8651964.1 hypothetical protein O0I10_012453 [Lichtheimia ornata]